MQHQSERTYNTGAKRAVGSGFQQQPNEQQIRGQVRLHRIIGNRICSEGSGGDREKHGPTRCASIVCDLERDAVNQKNRKSG